MSTATSAASPLQPSTNPAAAQAASSTATAIALLREKLSHAEKAAAEANDGAMQEKVRSALPRLCSRRVQNARKSGCSVLFSKQNMSYLIYIVSDFYSQHCLRIFCKIVVRCTISIYAA
jgi:hypothetical protein